MNELDEHKRRLEHQNIGRLPETEKVVELEDGKKVVKKFPETRDGTVKAIERVRMKIERETKNLRKRDEGKTIALGTSKTNYNDPRITVAWCKKWEVKIEKIFTKNLVSKFIWAMHTNTDWQF